MKMERIRRQMRELPASEGPFRFDEDRDWRTAAMHSEIEIVSITPDGRVTHSLANPESGAWMLLQVTMRPLFAAAKAPNIKFLQIVTDGEIFFKVAYFGGVARIRGRQSKDEAAPGVAERDLYDRVIKKAMADGMVKLGGAGV